MISSTAPIRTSKNSRAIPAEDRRSFTAGVDACKEHRIARGLLAVRSLLPRVKAICEGKGSLIRSCTRGGLQRSTQLRSWQVFSRRRIVYFL
jgi:hypothetical protein